MNDIEIGDIVTVLEWHKIEQTSGYGIMERTTYRQDMSYVGDELEVIAIDEPFVKVKKENYDHSITLNTNNLVLKKLSKEFVEAGKVNNEITK